MGSIVMQNRCRQFIGSVVVAIAMLSLLTCRVRGQEPPDPADDAREFRGLFVTTAYNLDWPKKPAQGDPDAATARTELETIVRLAKETKFNVIILQVRGFGDRIYESTLGDPWSSYVPEDVDWLKEWIDAAHKDGIELHVWLNPYRTRQQLLPTLPARPNEKHSWYDPHEERVSDHVRDSIEEILKVRGNWKKDDEGGVDGVLIDHYYYPYPPGPEIKDRKPKDNRDDIEKMMEKAFKKVLDKKSWIKFGHCPRSIPKRGLPEGFDGGYDQYEENFADVGKWWSNGRCDYIVPMFEARWDTPRQRFDKILTWWKDNRQNRSKAKPLLLAGILSAKVIAKPDQGPWPASEIAEQISKSRKICPKEGQVHLGARVLNGDMPADQDTAEELRTLRDQIKTLYAEPALVPQCVDEKGVPDLKKPETPPITIPVSRISWAMTQGATDPWLWAVWWNEGGKWRLEVHPATIKNADVPTGATWVAIAGVNKFNRLGQILKVQVRP